MGFTPILWQENYNIKSIVIIDEHLKSLKDTNGC